MQGKVFAGFRHLLQKLPIVPTSGAGFEGSGVRVSDLGLRVMRKKCQGRRMEAAQEREAHNKNMFTPPHLGLKVFLRFKTLNATSGEAVGFGVP